VIHDPDLLEKLGAFSTARFSGEVYRATRVSADPTAPTTQGGRWAPPGECLVRDLSGQSRAGETLEVEDTRTLDWQHWARANGLLPRDAM
jgi:hypothetical protein